MTNPAKAQPTKFMSLVEFKNDPTDREVRQFAQLWLPAACFALALWATYRLHNVSATVFAAVGLLSLLLGISRPNWMRWVYVAWTAAAFPLAWLVAYASAAAIYFLLIVPIGLVLRIAGHDSLARQFDREAQSYWTPRPVEADRQQHFRQF